MIGMTPTASRLSVVLDDEYRRMQNEWFFKWHFIGNDGPVEIESFDGQPIRYGGLNFSGSPYHVYWDTIQRYLRKKVVSLLSDIEIELTKYEPDIRAKIITECKPLIIKFAAQIRRAAVEKDANLRGDGFNFPKEYDRGSWVGSHQGDVEAGFDALNRVYCNPTINIGGKEVPMSSLMGDSVTLVKNDGRVAKEGIQSSVQKNKIFIFDKTLPIEVGDHFLRKLENGLTEDYIVESPNYISGGSLSHWEVQVRRSDEPLAPPQTIINNITGHNARVNINSTDSSINTVEHNSEKLFADLTAALAAGISDNAEKERLLALVSAMHEGTKDGSYKQKYQSFITTAANHMTVVVPFLPALANLL